MRARAACENLGLAALSMAASFLLVSRVDAAAVQGRLQGQVAERFGAGVLMGLGALFFPARCSGILRRSGGDG
jgi:hypothetical protein